MRTVLLVALAINGCSVDADVARFPLEVDASVDAASDAPPSLRCPQREGTPVMIDLGDLCIDATEVTRAQYARFLAERRNLDDPTCAWNSDLAPRVNPEAPHRCSAEHADLTRDVDHPVVCVDWCDAAAYCAWAGKRLCGNIGGGAQPWRDEASYNDPGKSEWYAACAGKASRRYPYGNAYEPGRCGDVAAGNRTHAVGAREGCHPPPGTAEAAVYDLSGNVYEWVDSCQVTTGDPRLQLCLSRGGYFGNDDAIETGPTQARLTCAALGVFANTLPRDHFDDHIGIRCCAR